MGRFHGDLPERSFQFAVHVLHVVQKIPDGTIGWTIAKQLTRSGTSVGANIAEADGALTKPEFANLCNIARREAAETVYWLRICVETQLLNGDFLEPLLAEAKELHDILATIVRKTHQQNQKNRE